MPVDYSSQIADLSQAAADRQGTINVYQKDIIDIQNEIQAARAKLATADAATSEGLAAQIQSLNIELTQTQANLAKNQVAKDAIDAQIQNLKLNQEDQVSTGQIPAPVTNQSNPSNPPGPEANAGDPLTTPPGTDEYDSLQSQIDANATGLPEPPVVSDEEVNTYLAGLPPAYDEPPVTAESLGSSTNGTTAPIAKAQGQAVNQNSSNIYAQNDWRVRLQLAAGSKYLYNDPAGAGILKPLIATKGVLFPYTPAISVNYAASYDASSPTHSNYKIFQYQSSVVDSFSITCDFTAQDTFEANYLIAVIHFFRSVTKMFYGQDQNPVNGTPPPLCYLTGMGAFNFDNHPLALTGFTYTLPTDVDYIPAGNAAYIAGQNQGQTGNQSTPRYGNNIGPGGSTPPPNFSNAPTGSVDPTWVPTKMSMTVTAVPIVSRNDISNTFSLKDYGSGKVYRGSTRNGAGIW